MKRLLLAAALLVLLLPCGRAFALELSAGRINPFVENELTFVSDAPGVLTIRVDGRMDAVTDLPIEAGTTRLTWRALSWNGEPIPRGKARLIAELTLEDGTVQTAEKTVNVRMARSAMLFCLPEHDTYVIGGAPLRVEIGVSENGRYRMVLVPAEEGAEPVWVWGGDLTSGNTEHMLTWNWRRPKAELVPGEYLLRAWTLACPEWVVETPITLTAEDTAPSELFLTGSLLPEDLDDDAAVWAAITAPVVVGDGAEGAGLSIFADKTSRSTHLGNVNKATVCLTVLDLSDAKWAKVGAWKQNGGEYIEGYVLKKQLTVVIPNCRYGAVIDKNTQTMRVYEDGHCIGTMPVSTGYQLTGAYRTNSETRAGAYLTGTRWMGFNDGGYTYQYPIRIDGPNLIHQVGWKAKDGYPAGFADQVPLLGTKVSHGCVRVPYMPTEASGGINAYWLWTHFGHNTKILIIDDPETRHQRMDELGMEY